MPQIKPGLADMVMDKLLDPRTGLSRQAGLSRLSVALRNDITRKYRELSDPTTTFAYIPALCHNRLAVPIKEYPMNLLIANRAEVAACCAHCG